MNLGANGKFRSSAQGKQSDRGLARQTSDTAPASSRMLMPRFVESAEMECTSTLPACSMPPYNIVPVHIHQAAIPSLYGTIYSGNRHYIALYMAATGTILPYIWRQQALYCTICGGNRHYIDLYMAATGTILHYIWRQPALNSTIYSGNRHYIALCIATTGTI